MFPRSLKQQTDLTGSLSAGDIWANAAIKGRGIDRQKRLWVLFKDLYLPSYLLWPRCGWNAWGSGPLQSQSGKIPQEDEQMQTNHFAVAVISDWTADISTSSLRERRCSSSTLLSDAQRSVFFFSPAAPSQGPLGPDGPLGETGPEGPKVSMQANLFEAPLHTCFYGLCMKYSTFFCISRCFWN